MKKLLRLLRHDWPVHFFIILTNWLPDNGLFIRLRGTLIAPFLGSCGSNLRLGRDITFYNPSRIHMGRDIYIAKGCWFMADADIHVGDEVLFGPYCVTVSSNHTRHNGSFRFGPTERAPIEIGAGSWLAAHVVVSAGSRIGKGTLVGAHALVLGDIPEHVMVGGQPARVLKDFEKGAV